MKPIMFTFESSHCKTVRANGIRATSATGTIRGYDNGSSNCDDEEEYSSLNQDDCTTTNQLPESNELHTLRQQLAESEERNRRLEIECCANARHDAMRIESERHIAAKYREENERLRMELKKQQRMRGGRPSGDASIAYKVSNGSCGDDDLAQLRFRRRKARDVRARRSLDSVWASSKRGIATHSLDAASTYDVTLRLCGGSLDVER